MCGIAGYSTIGSDRTIDPDPIRAMVAAIDHRGPDENGIAVFPQLAFANARLSIIDLEGGRQPIENEDGTVIVVFNGELYNYVEIRDELIVKGHVFKTKSDTEVLVHLYEEVGDSFVERLNGMFALALYDAKRRRLIVARDRFGVKPLFYSYKDGLLAFASEIKALKVLPEFDRTMDPHGMATYLGLFYIPDPWTIYKSVKKLMPGHYLVLDEGGLRDIEYYDLDLSKKHAISAEDAEAETARLFRVAVQRQMLSDVPVGVLLSGGLDSRSVLAAACQVRPGTSAFTIGFRESAFDEGDEASTWAKAVGADHRTMILSEDEFCDTLLARQDHLDEPYALWCNVATAALARFIRAAGHKVVLSGEGGDELFFGYPTVHAAFYMRYYKLLPTFVREKMVASVVRKMPAGEGRLPFAFMLKSFVEADHPDPYRTFFGFKEVVRYRDWSSLLAPDPYQQIKDIDPFIAFDQYRDKIQGLNYLEALSYLDFKVFLPACSFVGNDKAYMSASVESRVPFMDNDLVDFVSRLPLKVRFHPRKLKPVLRKALSEHVVAGVRTASRRYKKKGFEVPAAEWLKKGRFHDMTMDLLSSERIKRTGLFDPRAVQRVIADQMDGSQNNERLIQAIMCMTNFLERA